MSESERFFETILKANKITGYEQQHIFHPNRRWRFDFAWIEKKIAVEIDGGQWVVFGGRHNRDSDRQKINTATAMGWRILRFSTQEIKKNPCGCIDILKGVLFELL